MDLKDKFNNHQTEVDAEAWAHFQLLRNNQRPKRRFFWWFFFGGLVLIGVVGIIFWQSNKSTITPTERLSNQVTGSINIINDKELKKITAINESTASISKQNKNIPVLNSATKNKKNNDLNNSNRATLNNDFVENTTIQKEEGFQNTSQKIDNQTNTHIPQENELAKNIIENNLIKTRVERAADNRKINLVASIESPINKLLSIPDSIETLDVLLPSSLIKPIQSKKNTLKFGISLADAYVNGFSLENPVNKQGPAFQLEYYHEWNKIIGTGISAGYINMVDRKNPSVAIKGQETIKFLHANLYLFLLNENKHKLYAKIGAGLTNTDRVLGTFLVKVNGEVERTFQINNLTDIGFLVEGAYEYKLNKSFIIGANYSIISHNDGGWYTGLSIGYQF